MVRNDDRWELNGPSPARLTALIMHARPCIFGCIFDEFNCVSFFFFLTLFNFILICTCMDVCVCKIDGSKMIFREILNYLDIFREGRGIEMIVVRIV